MSAEQTPDIERVLAEHQDWTLDFELHPGGEGRGAVVARCSGTACDWSTENQDTIEREHRAHVAQALAPVLAAAWDKGYAAAEHMARCWGHTDWWEDEPENPYRADRVAEPQHEAATSSPNWRDVADFCPACGVESGQSHARGDCDYNGPWYEAATSGKESEARDE